MSYGRGLLLSARFQKQMQMASCVIICFFSSSVVQIRELLIQNLNIHKGSKSQGTIFEEKQT